MKHFLDKTRLAVRIAASSLAIVIATIAPHASAQDARTQALERSLRQLEASLQALRSELNQVKSESAREAQRIIKIEEMATSVEKRQTQEAQKVTNVAEKTDLLEARSNHKHNMLFFRGGFAHADHVRNGVSTNSSAYPGGLPGQSAWYIGAGFDWNLTRDAWGLAPRTSVASELMFEYKEFGQNVTGNGLNAHPGVNVSQLTLTAAPKIRFLEGSKIRPWIIPAGLGIHVISPPSESITVLLPGVMFGTGVDYNIWKNFFVGLDARYHLTSGRNDGIKIDGVTAGGYLGIGF
ncbi:MAG: porin family protein [Nitrosomonadaceae bacterium]|nr:porin family protein [Nitrosomonadaceae bacterium]